MSVLLSRVSTAELNCCIKNGTQEISEKAANERNQSCFLIPDCLMMHSMRCCKQLVV